jgi:hypothetical protein
MSDDATFRLVLHNRIKAIDTELVELTRRREALSTLRRSVEQTLAQEDALHREVEQIPAIHPTKSGMGLADLLLRLLESGPKSLEQLKEAGAGWPLLKDHNSPGRAINFALVGMQKGGHVERLPNETWKLISGSNRK